MTKPRLLIALAAAIAAAVVSGAAAPPANAAVTCSFNAGTAIVTLAAGDSAQIERFGTSIRVNNQPCGAATITTTTTINVTGGAGAADETVTINLSGGAFTPGGGNPDIQFNITLNGTATNMVRVVGGISTDAIALGSAGGGQQDINLNATGGNTSVDVAMHGVNAVQVNSGSGNDVVDASGGANVGGDVALSIPITISGGPGNDNLTAGSGNSTIDPGLGSDTANGGAGDDTFASSQGNDTLNGGGGTNTFDASFEAAAVHVDLGAGTATGTSMGSDTLSGIENVKGTQFSDVITGDGAGNQLTGFLGNDILNGAGGNDTINGGGGNDTINGGPGNDTLNGFSGNDVFVASDGNDAIDGGSASEGNRVDFSTQSAGVTVDLTGGTDIKPAGNDTITAVTNITGSPFNDNITGDGHANTISAGAGNDTVSAGPGRDTILGGAGTNSLDGGTGIDLIKYSFSTVGVNINLSSNTATATGISDTLSNIENVIGSIHNDVITGDSHDNVITGGAGNDTENGNSGNDTFNMGTTADGIDTVSGGPGSDLVNYAGRHGNLRVTLDGVRNDGSTGERDDIKADVENVVTGRGNDLIMGSSADNHLNGGPGHNTLSVAGAPRGVIVNLNTHSASNWGHDVVTSFQTILGSRFSDSLTGNILNNAINGGSGNDIENGLGGNDFLVGGPGNDRLNGGPGNDGCAGGPGTNVLISC